MPQNGNAITMSNKKALHLLIAFYLVEKSLELEPYSFFSTCTTERTFLSLSNYSCLYVNTYKFREEKRDLK